MNGISLCGLTAEDIFDLIRPLGFNKLQAVHISNGIYNKRINEIHQLPKIPKKLKEELSKISWPGIFQPVSYERSEDGTVKYLFKNREGLEYETVYLPDAKRRTVCVSTQSGCRMGCPPCVTGKYGFHGNLSVGDIMNQLISLPLAEKITHVVFMGMGEPMDNLENVLKACTIITSEWGMSLSPGNVTVSTVGITPGVKEFLEVSDCNLTVSLHSPFCKERAQIIPVEKKYPVYEIVEIMKAFHAGKRRRMSLAYVMIKGVNDSPEHLEALKRLVSGSGIRINLLPYHSVPNDSATSSAAETIYHFKHELMMSGISASVRRTRGLDISAACGLLASGLLK